MYVLILGYTNKACISNEVWPSSSSTVSIHLYNVSALDNWQHAWSTSIYQNRAFQDIHTSSRVQQTWGVPIYHASMTVIRCRCHVWPLNTYHTWRTWHRYRHIAWWNHIWTLPYTSIWPPPCWGSEMYCGDWEKGANRIVAFQRKWLLQQNYNICKIHVQVHIPFHASLIGIVTGVGEQTYVNGLVSFSQSPQYINFVTPNMAAAKQTYMN